MPLKTILLTDPDNCLLRELGMRFLQTSPVRLVCFADPGPEQPGAIREIIVENGVFLTRSFPHVAIDEAWLARNPGHISEQSQTAVEHLLALVRRNGIGSINYLSTLFVAGGKDALTEAPCDSDGPLPGLEEECHRRNEKTVEMSGQRFRIFRLPLLADGTPHSMHPWPRFIHLVSRFKSQIEDRIPKYFAANSLRIRLPHPGMVNLINVDRAVSIVEEIAANDGGRMHFNVLADDPVPLDAYFPTLADFSGVTMQVAADERQLNPVDQLFALKV
ncbi:MAG: hypothetical protein ACRD4F_05060, partial [Candidatus Angelobacter sp.]